MLGLGLSFARQTAKVFSYVKDSLKAYFRFYDTTPDFLLDGSTSFDGTDDYISIADADNLSFGDGSTDSALTFSAWVKMDDAQDFKIFSKGIFNTNFEYYFGTFSGRNFGLELYDEDVTSTYERAYTSSALTSYEGQWVHLCATYDGRGGASANAGITLYVNGVSQSVTLDDSGTYVSMVNGGADLHIGRYSTNYEKGSMANIGIWNRALSASEIESIYWRGSYSELKGTELTNLVSWYDLDSTSLGSELVTNGGFDADVSGWTQTNLTATYNSGTAVITNQETANDEFLQSVSLDEGVGYEVSATISNYSAGSSTVVLRYDNTALTSGGSGGDRVLGTVDGNKTITATIYGTSGSETLRFRCTGTGSATNYTIDNVSVKAIQTPDAQGSNEGNIVGATVNSDSYSGESPFKPRIQDIATPKMAVQLSEGSTSFDGTDDYISIPAVSLGNPDTGWTVGVWAKSTDSGDDHIIFSNSSGGSISSKYGITNQHIWFSIYADQGSGATWTNYEASTPNVLDGQWHYLTWVMETDSTDRISMYVDGSLVDADNSLGDSTGGQINAIGRGHNFTDAFQGELSNFARYTRPLTQTQVQELMFTEKYSGLSADLKTNLVSWYDLGSTSFGEKFTIASAVSDANGNEADSLGNFEAVSSPSLFEVSGTGKSDTTNNVGTYAIKTTGGGDGKGLKDLTLVDGGLTIGASYTLSFDYKMASGIVQFILQKGTSAGGIANTYDSLNSTSWASYSTTFTATEDDVRFYLYQYGSTSATWYFDNLSIKEVQAEDKQGSNEGSIIGATTTTGYTSSPHGVVDPLNYGEVYSGRALDFDGSNDNVAIGSDSSLNFGTGDFSISLWVNGTDTDGVFYSSYDGSTPHIHFRTTSSKVTFNMDSSSSDEQWASTTTGVIDGKWHHLVVSVDKSVGVSMYIDGSLETLSATGTIGSVGDLGSSEDFKIGSHANDSTYWDGKISNVKLFNSALTQAQVRELYTKPETVLPTGVSASNLKLDLPMQEGAGSYIYDGSGNQNHGTISGATWATGESDGYQSSLVRSNTPMIFDGVNDGVEIPSSLSLHTWNSKATVQAWVYPNSVTDWDGIWGGATGSTGTSICFGTGGYIKISSDSGSPIIWSNGTVTLKKWNHVVVSYDGSTANFYINGSSVGYQGDGQYSQDAVGSTNICLGQYYAGSSSTSYKFDGSMNEVAYWDTNLDADAVAQLYNSGTPLLPTSDSGNYDNSDDLQGYWRNDGIATWTDRTPLGAYGSELITNGDNESAKAGLSDIRASSSQSNEQAQSGTYSYKAVANSANDTHYSRISLTLNKPHKVTGYAYLPSGQTISSLKVGYDNSGDNQFSKYTISTTNSWVAFEVDVPANASYSYFTIGGASGSYENNYWYIDSVSVKKTRGGNDGTASGSPVSIVIPEGSTEGRDNQGFLLSDTTSITNGIRLYGNGEYIEIPTSESLTFGDSVGDKPFSIEFWGKAEAGAVRPFYVWKAVSNRSDAEYWAYVTTSQLLFYIGDSSSSHRLGRYENKDVRDGNWHHYVFSYDGSGVVGGLKIYYDSARVDDSSDSLGSYTAMQNENLPIVIGRVGTDGTDYADGLMDEFRIYQKELSASEVTKNYNNGKSAHQ